MKLSARIVRPSGIKVSINEPSRLSVQLRNVQIASDGYRPPTYEGEYEVIPSASEAKVLNTAQTFLESDVTVRKIPYYEVSNNSDGTTVYIANEV